MAIRVEHAPSAGMAALAGLMSGMGRGAEGELEARRQAGRLAVQLDARQTMQTQQLREQRNRQMEQIEAAADRQKQAADDAMARTALNFGLEEQIREDKLERQLTGMREEARLRSEQWEYQYSTKQRQEIARFNDARQRISRDPNFSEDERAAAMRAIELQQAGIAPSLMPRDPNKPTFAEGREPGAIWKDPETGAMVQTKIGTGGQPEVGLLVRPDQTVEYLREKLQAEQERAETDLRIKREDARRAYIEKLMSQQVPVMAEAKEGGFLGYGAEEAGPTGEKQFRTYEDAVRLADQVYGRQLGEQAIGETPEQRDVGVPRNLIGSSRAMGVKRTEADANLPEFVGMAQAFMREVKRRAQKDGQIPSHMAGAIQEAQAILLQHAAGGGL